MVCGNCTHSKDKHLRGEGACQQQTRGRQSGEDDYCECPAFVASQLVYHQVADGISVSGNVHGDARYKISVLLPQSMSTGDALWLADRLKEVAEVIETEVLKLPV